MDSRGLASRLSVWFLALAGLATHAWAQGAAAPVTLRFAALPIIDSVPLYVAEEEGLFAAAGVKVEFLEVGASPERDQLLAAGQADGAINEIQAVILFNREGVRLKALRYALRPGPGSPHFFILAAGSSGIKDAQGLAGVEIGVAQGTITEYVTERLLKAEGLTGAEIRTIPVMRISDRMALLASGRLKAGTMPDPLASLSRQQGARLILDDSRHPEYGYSVVSFRRAFIEAHPEALRSFFAALEKATLMVNADPGRYGRILSDRKIVPPALAGGFRMPRFPTAGVPTRAEFEDAGAWLKEKGLFTGEASWASSVDPSFLP